MITLYDAYTVYVAVKQSLALNTCTPGLLLVAILEQHTSIPHVIATKASKVKIYIIYLLSV